MITAAYDRAVTALLNACYGLRGVYRRFWPWSRWRRGLISAREVAAQDAALNPVRRAQAPPGGWRVYGSEEGADERRRRLASTYPVSPENETAYRVIQDLKAAMPPRYVRVYAGTAGGITLVHSSPDQHGFLSVREPGCWVGWKADGSADSSWIGVNGAPVDRAAITADVEVLAIPEGGQRFIPVGEAWNGNACERLTFIPGTTINFWPGRVEVVGP